MGRVAEARREFQLALARTPGRSLTLLDLARASHAIGDSAAASAAYKQLVSNWHRADAVTDAVREARRAARTRFEAVKRIAT
jgi:thioredoxin-like negative regulator of GroEL